MENELRKETSRILNTAQLIGEGAEMVNGDIGPRLEVTETQFNDAHAEMQDAFDARASKAFWERVQEMSKNNTPNTIARLRAEGKTSDEIRQYYRDAAWEAEAEARDAIDRLNGK